VQTEQLISAAAPPPGEKQAADLPQDRQEAEMSEAGSPPLQRPGDHQPDRPGPSPQGVQTEKPVSALDIGEKKTGPTNSPAHQEEAAAGVCVQSNRRQEAPGSSISHRDVDGRQAQRLPEDGRKETDAADAPGNHLKEARSTCISGGDGPQAETLPEDSPEGGQTKAHSEGCASRGRQEETCPMD
jgi:hypothetical protein